MACSLTFPSACGRCLSGAQLQETPKQGDPAFRNSRYVTVLSNQTAVSAAAERAKLRGFDVEIDNSCDDWDYAQAADYLLARLRALRRISSPVCLISGGEVTVKVGDKSGIGGRNQQFALYCAQKIEGEPITVLSAGTDGIDGNSPAAGAVVDGTHGVAGPRTRARSRGGVVALRRLPSAGIDWRCDRDRVLPETTCATCESCWLTDSHRGRPAR